MSDQETKYLILGASGQLGTALVESARAQGLRVTAPLRNELDITDKESVTHVVGSNQWSCIINSAAYTNVDAAERDEEEAWRTNALGPRWLATAAHRSDTPIVHVSTDYVFDGRKPTAYRPADSICPLNVYGRTKAAGEEEIKKASPRNIVIRTSWVISPFGRNFVKSILANAARQERLTVVSDQFGRPTSAVDLANAIWTIAQRLLQGSVVPFSTLHFANEGRTTWYDLALATMAGARARGARTVPVDPIPVTEYSPAVAHRPQNSELFTEDLGRNFGIYPRSWQSALDDILDHLIRPKG